MRVLVGGGWGRVGKEAINFIREIVIKLYLMYDA